MAMPMPFPMGPFGTPHYTAAHQQNNFPLQEEQMAHASTANNMVVLLDFVLTTKVTFEEEVILEEWETLEEGTLEEFFLEKRKTNVIMN